MATIGDVNISPIQSYIAALNRGLGRLSISEEVEPSGPSASERASAASLYSELESLRESLEKIRNPLPLRRVEGASGQTVEVTAYTAAEVTSAGSLGLEATYATLTSSEEVNTTPTSYSAPSAYSGASSATPLIGGVYDGRYGDATMVFNVTKGGTVDVDELEVRVDIGGVEVARIRELPFAADTPYALLDKDSGEDTGLTLSLGAGTLVDLDSFTVDISATQGTAVNPDNPLDGVGSESPRLDEGYGISAGVFYLNDSWSTVASDDTLNQLMTRISNSSSGVSALYDSASDRVVLTSKQSGSGGTVDLGSDSSGLFSALKLDTATLVAGLDPGEGRALAETIPAIASGQLLINGVAIAVDRDSDSLNDLLARINGSAAGVSAQFDPDSQRVTIRSLNEQQSLQLDSNGTGLFAALGMSDGQYDPSATTVEQPVYQRDRYTTPRATARAAVRAYDSASSSVNSLFNPASGLADGVDRSIVDTLRSSIRGAIRDSFTDLYRRYDEHDVRFDSPLGIDADFSGARADPLRFGADQRSEMLRGMLNSGRSVNRLLFGSRSEEDDGMVERMLLAIEQGQRQLRERYGDSGLLVDALA